jgi:hypothetical protein
MLLIQSNNYSPILLYDKYLLIEELDRFIGTVGAGNQIVKDVDAHQLC